MHLKAAKIHIAREGDESGTPLYQGLRLPFPDDCSRGKQDRSWWISHEPTTILDGDHEIVGICTTFDISMFPLGKGWIT